MRTPRRAYCRSRCWPRPAGSTSRCPPTCRWPSWCRWSGAARRARARGRGPEPWRLTGAAGGPLPPDATLDELGVLDGELLRLGPRPRRRRRRCSTTRWTRWPRWPRRPPSRTGGGAPWSCWSASCRGRAAAGRHARRRDSGALPRGRAVALGGLARGRGARCAAAPLRRADEPARRGTRTRRGAGPGRSARCPWPRRPAGPPLPGPPAPAHCCSPRSRPAPPRRSARSPCGWWPPR